MCAEYPLEQNNNFGWIEVITGPMFSGKTEELIRRLKRATLANQKVKIFKPKIDNRFSAYEVVSHDDNSLPSIPVENSNDIYTLSVDANIVAMDEAQFFDNYIVEVCKVLAGKGMRVIIAGLDMDYMGNPFGPVPQLMATAEYVTKLQAICVRCRNLAYVSHRKTDDKNLILLGEKAEYEPLCRNCFNELMNQENDTI